MSENLPITAVIPVKNEEGGLATCLERLGRFANIVVIDSGSSDRTTEIAESFGATVLQFDWDGQYPKKRNWMLLNHPPTQPWVLFLDADEIIDETFCDSLNRELPDSVHDGYWLTYSNNFLGRPLRHGVQQRKLALFRSGKALYERIEEDGWSDLDMEIHEHPIIDGTVGEINTPIEHRDDRGLARFLNRHVDYAKWEARRLPVLEADPDAWERLTSRQRFKYRNLRKWWYPWFYFLGAYAGKGGFRDGAVGFHYAFYKAWYFHTIRLLILEVKQQTTSQ
jgi:glycosyltransferase involved in cell wall biosynthesis